MKRIVPSLLLLSVCVFSNGQDYIRRVLQEVEQNNPTLKAAAAEREAEQLAGRAGALLPSPEVEFNYLWGADDIGRRHDLLVSQSFDIPTLTGMKAGKASDLGELAALRYKTERQAILLEAEQACIDLVYWNAILDELRGHLEQSVSLADSYEKRMKAGESTVLDLNKARIHQASVLGQVHRAEAERQTLLSALCALNGGKEIAFDRMTFDLDGILPDHFETWFEDAADRSPMLGFVRKQVELEERQVAIDKASALPGLSVGYMSEIRTGEKFRGVTIGVDIPLWSAGNKVRQSVARAEAAAERRNAAEQKYYSDLRSQFAKARLLKENSEMMRRTLSETDNRKFLFSALTKGEISMIDYMVEIDLYYEALEATLEAERDYRHALAGLYAFTL